MPQFFGNAFGCTFPEELGCAEIADVFLQVEDDDGTVVQAECPGLCPVLEPPKVYGTGIYAGVCLTVMVGQIETVRHIEKKMTSFRP